LVREVPRGWPAGYNGAEATTMPATIDRPLPWYVDDADCSTAPRRRAEFIAYLRVYGDPDDDYDAAEVIFGELVGNLVQHAPGPYEMHVEWSAGHATLHVTDEGSPLDVRTSVQLAGPFDEHGRGLALVAALSGALHSVAYPGYGKTVSAALPVRPALRS
jgi:hypothetical protein